MPSLKDLANNISTFKYYSGYGTFIQNNLSYGKDRPGGGDSYQPFVIRKAGERWSPSNFNDNLTPFGAVTTISRTLADVYRISRFLTTTIQGPLFIIKQYGLQRSNPDIEQSSNVEEFDKIGDTRIYNPASAIAQAAVNASGLHLLRHGTKLGFSKQDSYEKLMLSKDTNDGFNTNRMGWLTSKLSDSPNRSYVLSYVGGPNSFFGIGKTTLTRSGYILNNDISDSSGFISIPVRNLYKIFDNSVEGVAVGNHNYREIYVDIDKARDRTTGEEPPVDVFGNPVSNENVYTLNSKSDFRKYKNALNYKKNGNQGTKLAETDYATYNLEDRIGIARVRPASDRSNYASNQSLTADRINAISLYYSNAPASGTDINGKEINPGVIRDIVKFRIKILDNDKMGYGTYIVFRAYLTNVRRNMTSKWDPYKYVGRGETFYAYDGFTEAISFSFVIAASTRAEMKPLYQKLNYLMSSLTPDYGNQKSRGNIAELTIGDFILYQPGIITNLDINIEEDFNWEIAINEPEKASDTDMHELPQMLRCNMSFIPIYNFLPRKSSEAPFIGINGVSGSTQPEGMWLKDTNSKLK